MDSFFYVNTLRRLKKEQKTGIGEIKDEMNKEIKCKIKKGLIR